ncbi:hypothetical protein A2U01_0076404, partial [Trifolium medium]|nr:hypothetical protein [Trifolium medium]
TKNAKDGIAAYSPKKNLAIEPASVSQFTTVAEKCKKNGCGSCKIWETAIDA